MKCTECGIETSGLYTINDVLTPLCSKCYFTKWQSRKKKKSSGSAGSFKIVTCKRCGGNYKTNEKNDSGICTGCENEINSENISELNKILK